jgi:Protein of unknown function (DUF933)
VASVANATAARDLLDGGTTLYAGAKAAGFIKAEIVGYDDLMTAGSMAAAKAAGKVRVEGKDYIMRDGDVVEFRFNV